MIPLQICCSALLQSDDLSWIHLYYLAALSSLTQFSGFAIPWRVEL